MAVVFDCSCLLVFTSARLIVMHVVTSLLPGRFLHPFEDTATTALSESLPRCRSVPQYAADSLTRGRIPRLIAPRTLFSAVAIGERFIIVTGGQAPNFPTLSSVELFVRLSPSPPLSLLRARATKPLRFPCVPPASPSAYDGCAPFGFWARTSTGFRRADGGLGADASDAILTRPACYGTFSVQC